MKGFSISGGHEITADVAADILEDGGNAFDAAIAAHAAMFITEPCMSSPGGAGFALCEAVGQKPRLIDFFCETPLNKKKDVDPHFYPVTVDFGEGEEEFFIGLGSMATPGTIAGLFYIHEKYGSIPMETLLQPAIQLAKEGVAINTFQYLDLTILCDIFKSAETGRQIFFNGDSLKNIGDITRMPELASFLEFLAKEGSRGFYQGEFGRKVAEKCSSLGGFLTRADFESYRVVDRKPLHFQFGGTDIYTNPLPSTGGGLIAITLTKVERMLLEGHSIESALIEALKYLQPVLDDLSLLEAELATFFNIGHTDKSGGHSTLGTTHLNVIDSAGNVVALTCSIGEGSGYFVQGTGVHMNNMLGEAALLPGGFHSWIPDRRLSSMMAPTVIRDKTRQMDFALGSGGAGRIPFMISEVIIEILLHHKHVAEAVDQPRGHLHSGILHIEPDFTLPPIDLLETDAITVKRWNSKNLFFGGVHVSSRSAHDGFDAAADARRYGVGIVR